MGSFRKSDTGKKVIRIIADSSNLDEMIDASKRGIPAVQAIGKQIEALGDPITDSDKQQIGIWVRDALEKKGWILLRKGVAVVLGHFFSKGTIYKRRKSNLRPA